VHSIAIILIVLGGLLFLANWICFIQSYRTKRFHSSIPLFGAGMLGGGMLLLPVTRSFAWLAIPLDYGTLAFVIASPRMVREMWSTSRLNLVHEYSGGIENRSARLRFFRRGVFTMRFTIERPVGQSGLVRTGTGGTWSFENEKLKLQTHGRESAIFKIFKTSDSEFIQMESGFPNFEQHQETSFAGMKLSLSSKTDGLLLPQKIGGVA
jgi:hypothetical protein